MSFATDRTRRWRTAPAKAIAARVSRIFLRHHAFDATWSRCLLSSLSLSNVVKAIAGSTIIAMSPLSRYGLGIGPQSGECKQICSVSFSLEVTLTTLEVEVLGFLLQRDPNTCSTDEYNRCLPDLWYSVDFGSGKNASRCPNPHFCCAVIFTSFLCE